MRIKLSGVPDRKKIWSKFVELKSVELPFQSAKRIAKNGGKKEDDPNSSFRRREIARVLLDLAAELFRFKLNR